MNLKRLIARGASMAAVLMLCSACSDEPGAASKNAATANGSGSPQADQYASTVSAIREGWLSGSFSVESDDPSSIVRPDAPFELWMALAILSDAQGQRYALQQQLIRLKVKPEIEGAESAWDYSDIMALNYRLEALGSGAAGLGAAGLGVAGSGATRSDALDSSSPASNTSHVIHAEQQVQRVALELAGIEPSNAVQADESSMHDEHAQKSVGRAWVGAFEYAAATSIRSDKPNPDESNECYLQHTLNTPQLALQFEQTHCIDVQSTNQFAITRDSGLPITGTLKVDGEMVEVDGHGWLMHAWGIPPETSESAVVFDRAWLWLDDSVDIQVQRSRRRSGRGPMTSTGNFSLSNTHGGNINSEASRGSLITSQRSRPLVNPVFDDVVVDENDDEPRDRTSFNFQEISQQIDVDLFAVGENVNEDIGGYFFFEGQLNAGQISAVLVEGSHSGAGFINIAPVSQ